jgi:hypothetical protein
MQLSQKAMDIVQRLFGFAMGARAAYELGTGPAPVFFAPDVRAFAHARRAHRQEAM